MISTPVVCNRCNADIKGKVYANENWCPGCEPEQMKELRDLNTQLSKLYARVARRDIKISDLRLECAKLRAANSMHMQTLAIIAHWDIAGTRTGHEFATERKAHADAAAACTTLADCVVATPQ